MPAAAPAAKRSRTAAAAAEWRDRIAALAYAPTGVTPEVVDGPLRPASVKELGGGRLLVSVAPTGGGRERAGRGASVETVEVSVGVQSLCDPGDAARHDRLVAYMEAVADAAEAIRPDDRRDTLPGGVSVEFNPLYDGGRLDAGVFEGVVTASYVRPRGLRRAGGAIG